MNIPIGFLTVLVLSSSSVLSLTTSESKPDINCQNVSVSVLEQIRGYKGKVRMISESILNGSFKGTALGDLTYFVDKHGSRLTGSESLEKSIDYILSTMKDLGFENVHSEDVIAPKWIRGEESLRMTKPYKKTFPLLGLVPSVATPLEGITAEIIAVNGFEDLKKSVQDASNKIIVFNQPFDNPVDGIKYRQFSAVEAAKLGAVATLVRSYATFTLGNPHTGLMFYQDGSLPIPSAEISIEDADFLYRLYKKGEKIEVTLKLLNEHAGNITTRNSIGDFKGLSKPEEFVLISGHIDSFDVGQGALDDGYGVILSVKAVEVLRALGLQTRRSIRTIIWSAEEVGEVPLGAAQYLVQHLEELKTKYSVFLEADSGVFDANGLIFNGTDEAGCIVAEILKLLEPEVIPKSKLFPHFPHIKTDIVPLMQGTGVPGALIATNADKYFWYHHSNADTVTAISSKDMDVCLALYTAVSFVLADLDFMLPR